MANRSVGLLTDRQAKLAKKTIAVGGVKGLVLRVRELQSGSYSKIFIIRAVIDGKEKKLSIGSYPEVSLEEARKIAVEWRGKMLKGDNPRQEFIEKRIEKTRLKESKKTYSVQQMLFDYLDFGINRNWHDSTIKGKKISRSHQEIVLGYMRNHIPKDILLMPVKDLTPELLAETFKEKWLTMVDTPERVIGEISRAFDYAVKAEKISDMKNPASLDGKLGILLPPNHLRVRKGHHAALHPDRIPEFFEELSKHTGVASKLAMYSILTASRATNSRLMTWSEVHLDSLKNIDAPIHVIPREEMKVKRVIEFDRETPLSKQAVEVLKSLPRFQVVSEHDFVFAIVGRNGAITALTPAAISVLIRKINYERKKKGLEPFVDHNILRNGEPVSITLHGTARASFETWASDSVRYGHKQFSQIAIEHCLDHVTGKYNNAYLRRAVIGEMREVFEAWGEHCFSKLK